MTNALGVSRQTIIAIKNDTYNLSLEIAVKIGGCCGNRAIFFFGGFNKNRRCRSVSCPFPRETAPRTQGVAQSGKRDLQKTKTSKKTSLVLLAQGF